MRFSRVLIAASLAIGFHESTAQDRFPNPIPKGGIVVDARPFASLPLHRTNPARANQLTTDPNGRIYVVLQNGRICEISDDGAWVTTYLDLGAWGISSMTSAELGLQSVAFHPDFYRVGSPGYGKFYTSVTTTAEGQPDFTFAEGETRYIDYVLHEWSVENPMARPFVPRTSGEPIREVLRIAAPDDNHTMGLIAFNPNARRFSADYGNLYIGMGDGGGQGDPKKLAQNRTVPYGKILRINPLGTNGTNGQYGIPTDNPFVGDPSALPEIWALGFRNPQRFVWDRGGAKRMYIADIGQDSVEEINIGKTGANYGWSNREGSFWAVSWDPSNAQYTDPIAEYDHSEGRAVTVGPVYRGVDIGALHGKLLFGDIALGRVFYLDADSERSGGMDGIAELRLRFDGVESSFLEFLHRERVDLRFGTDHRGRVFLINKQDSQVRVLMDPSSTPTPIPTPTPAPTPIPFTQNTVLALKSDPHEYVGQGDSYFYSSSGTEFAVTPAIGGFSLKAGDWSILMFDPSGMPLAVGKYENGFTPEGQSFGRTFSFSSPFGHNAVGQGSFEIKEILSVGNQILSLWVVFSQTTTYQNPARLNGEIRFNANVPESGYPSPTPFPTPTPYPLEDPTPTPFPTPTATPEPTVTPEPSVTPAPPSISDRTKYFKSLKILKNRLKNAKRIEDQLKRKKTVIEIRQRIQRLKRTSR